MKTLEYLEAAQKKIGTQQNAELARALGIGRAAITKYKNGDQTMDDYTAAKVAEVLGIDPMTVIAQAHAEREKNATKAAFWRKLAATVSTAMAVVFLTTTPTQTANASTAYSGPNVRNTNYGGSVRRRAATLALQIFASLFRRPRILRTS